MYNQAMAFLERLAPRAVATLIPPLLLLGNLYLLISPHFLDFQYSLELPPAERFTAEERVFWAKKTLDYLRTPADISSLATLADEQGPLYNQRELAHMVDVKVLLDRVLLVHKGMLVVAALAVISLLARPGRRALIAHSLFQGSLLTIGLVGSIAVFAALGFSIFFESFHRLFFVGDTWLFSYSDTLIQLFPPPFWYNAVLILGGLTIGEAAVIGLLAYLRGRSRPRLEEVASFERQQSA